MRVCVCVLRNTKHVGAHLYTCMIEVPQSMKKSDGRVGARKTDSKTTSNILFSLVGCQTEKKKKKDKQRGPTFSVPAYRQKGFA